MKTVCEKKSFCCKVRNLKLFLIFYDFRVLRAMIAIFFTLNRDRNENDLEWKLPVKTAIVKKRRR